MSMENDALELLDAPAGGIPQNAALPPWKVLIVDDEGDVHAVTKLVLDEFRFRGRPLTFLDAYSGSTACEVLADHPDTAVVFLDVVMETRDAGLKVIRHVREVLKNPRVRIILRTGQPGEAPEQEVIVNYDINDYKCKTELTAQKLCSTMIVALRTYEGMSACERDRCRLSEAFRVAAFAEPGAPARFLAGLLMQVAALTGVSGSDLLLARRSSGRETSGLTLIAAQGRYAAGVGREAASLLDGETLDALRRTMATDSVAVGAAGRGVVLALSGDAALLVSGEVSLDAAGLTVVANYAARVYRLLCEQTDEHSLAQPIEWHW
jgi:CheY-like chemotaxis protein